MKSDHEKEKTPDGPINSSHIVAAALAGGMMASSGLPHSVAEALAVFSDVFWNLYPDRSSEHYIAWAEKVARGTPR